MRRKGRECALQILYQLDLQRQLVERGLHAGQLQDVLQHFWQHFEAVDTADKAYAERLVGGVLREITYLDTLLSSTSHHWKMHRMGKVDRNVLRIAAYEILFCPDIPKAVGINEAIEIARRFSGDDAVAFINGMLDKLEEEQSIPCPINLNPQQLVFERSI